MRLKEMIMLCWFITLASGCAETTTEVQQSEFTLRLTDSPGDYSSLDIELVGVDAYHNKQGWISLNSERRIINILSLTNGHEIEIASKSPVPAGIYTGIRLRYGDNNKLGLVGSGSQYIGFEENAAQETIVETYHVLDHGAPADILLDFDVAASVRKELNKYSINPVIKEIRDENTGVHGQIKGGFMAAILITNGESTYSTYMMANSEFMVRGMHPGIYNMTIVPSRLSPEGHAPAEQQIKHIVIEHGVMKEMGLIQL